MKSIPVSGCPDLCCSFSNLEKDSAFGRILNTIYSKHPVVHSLDACFAGAYLCGVTKKYTFFSSGCRNSDEKNDFTVSPKTVTWESEGTVLYLRLLCQISFMQI